MDRGLRTKRILSLCMILLFWVFLPFSPRRGMKRNCLMQSALKNSCRFKRRLGCSAERPVKHLRGQH